MTLVYNAYSRPTGLISLVPFLTYVWHKLSPVKRRTTTLGINI